MGTQSCLDIEAELSKILAEEINKSILNNIIEEANKIEEERKENIRQNRENRINDILDDKKL
jgi:hypothetical protein